MAGSIFRNGQADGQVFTRIRSPGHGRVIASSCPAGWSRVASAVRRSYADGIRGEVTWTYHAQVGGLTPETVYRYTVTADNETMRLSSATARRGSART
ncbi:MAG TPA: hypothetical protein VGG25_24465 [Streptosporangiaceae bacterium]